jgi:AraC-like DNA-binding protein
VVFDFMNPTASQLQLLQCVKRQYPSVPIVMITETHNEELAVWAFRARVWNYLVKPVPLRELKANLRQLAKVTQQRSESDSRRVERPGTMLPTVYAPPEPRTEEAVMLQITEHIRRDHTGRLSISKLARSCGMSRFSFSRLFRKNFGVSCRDYVMRLRIETACRLLEGGAGVSISDVAATAGFTDASYFARMFRSHMNVSPKEYALQKAAESNNSR